MHLKNLQFCDNQGQILPYRAKRKFSLGREFLKIDTEMMYGQSPNRNLLRNSNLNKMIIKDFIRHPFHFITRSINTWKISFDKINAGQLPIKFSISNGEKIKYWVSRQAILNGFTPSDLDPSLEYDYKRNPGQFNFMIRKVNLPKSLSYEFYGKELFELKDVPYSKNAMLKYQIIDNAEIHSGRILTKDKKIIAVSNLRAEKISEHGEFLKNSTDSNKIFLLKSISRASTIPIGIFIGYSSSWFHFLIECIPRLIVIPKELRSKIPIILPWGAPRQIKELCLALTGVPSIELKLLEKISIKKIIVGIETGVSDPLKFGFRKKAIIQMLSELKHLNLINNQEMNKHDKIFLKRPKGLFRPLQNEWFVIKLMRINRIKVVSPEKMSFKEALDYFTSAKLIVAESGGTMTNIVFASKKTHVIELYPGQGLMTFWPDFAKIPGVTVHKVLGQRIPVGLKGLKIDGYYISLIKLQKQINILNNQESLRSKN